MSEDVVVCDLDGTLLSPEARLSEFAVGALNRLLAAGVPLTVATSRRTVSIRALLAGVDLRLPVIELNGAFIAELASGRRLVSHILGESAAHSALEAMTAAGADPVITAWDGTGDSVHFGSRLNEGSTWFIDEKRAYGGTDLVESEDLTAVIGGERVAAITGFVPDSEGDDLANRLTVLVGDVATVYGAPNYYCPGWTEVQVQDAAADKGAAIPALLAAAGLTGAAIVACGDHLNDIGMFYVAKRSIAPSNAHPKVRELADVVVGSNAEDGVVRYLLEQYGTPQSG